MVWLESDETACLEKKLNDLPTQIVQKCNYSRKCILKYMFIVSSIFELFSKL